MQRGRGRDEGLGVSSLFVAVYGLCRGLYRRSSLHLYSYYVKQAALAPPSGTFPCRGYVMRARCCRAAGSSSPSGLGRPFSAALARSRRGQKVTGVCVCVSVRSVNYLPLYPSSPLLWGRSARGVGFGRSIRLGGVAPNPSGRVGRHSWSFYKAGGRGCSPLPGLVVLWGSVVGRPSCPEGRCWGLACFGRAFSGGGGWGRGWPLMLSRPCGWLLCWSALACGRVVAVYRRPP